MTLRIGRTTAAALLALAITFAAGGVQAQSIFGFRVGEDFSMAAKTHGSPSVRGAQGEFSVAKWGLANGNTVSVTAAPQTGRVVYVESDWGGDPASAASEIPGFTFGVTRLADIRERFRSNGFGFKSNLVSIIGKDVVSFNCFQVQGNESLIVVFVTVLPISGVPTIDGKPKPDLGQGRLDAVILADLGYLKGLWGEDRLFDPRYHPIDWT